MSDYGPALRSDAFEPAVNALIAGLTASGLGVHPNRKVMEAVARRTIRTYVQASADKPRNQHNVAPETRLLAEMAEGDLLEFPPAVRSVYHSRMKTARALMGVAGARWRCATLADGTFWITRLADWSRPVVSDPRTNAKAVFLASLTVSQGAVRAPLFTKRNQLGVSAKDAARKILGREDANWKGYTTNRGVMIKRVA